MNTTTETHSEEQARVGTVEATYCPEDNKLRLYVGRVPRDEYLKLRAEGWTSTPKQDCDFVATWTPQRRDTALAYAGLIGDEDQGPDERAADRAERFGDYRDKRTDEATGHADSYDTTPIAHGYQSQARAERSAARHDRIASHAVDAWSKAEYWQRRTAGVISHALHKAAPGVRMGRIKTLEAELRGLKDRIAKSTERFKTWQNIAAMTDAEKQTNIAKAYADYEHGDYVHPVTGKTASLYRLFEEAAEVAPLTGAEVAALWLANHSEPAQENDWTLHYELRLAYENQMLEAQGGRAAHVEMIPGGWLGNRQILKVNKSSVTGRVTSVEVMGTSSGYTQASGYKEYSTWACPVLIETERLSADAYRAPTEQELIAFTADQKAKKDARPKVATIPLINPTDEDAERLQAIWNERAKVKHDQSDMERYGKVYVEFKPATVTRIKQATYSAASKGSYARAETRAVRKCAHLAPAPSNMYDSQQAKLDKEQGPAVCSLRICSGSDTWPYPRSVIILTDKPQKPLPGSVWQKYEPALELATA